MNRLQRKRVFQLICVGACGFTCIWLVANWGLVRFALYHSQNRLLQPDDYDAKVIAVADYKHLSDPTQRTVTLFNGTRLQKAEKWESVVLPNYKPIEEGSRYVLITLKGTAPFVFQLEATIIPVFVVSLIGFVVGIISLRKDQLEKPEA